MTDAPIDIISACRDPELFGRWFKDETTWIVWFVFLRAVFRLPLSDDDLAIFKQCTGRNDVPPDGSREAWLCCGRRSGKSLMLALIAAYLASMIDWSPYLTPGERGTVMVIAADRRQARTIFRYLRAMFKETILASLIERETNEQLDLTNGISIEILTASFRTVRGYTLIAALCDELAFWRHEESGANPDREVIGSIRPAMSTIPQAMLLCASSPYARRGELWNAYRRHFERPGPVLFWKAGTVIMNPTVDRQVIVDAIEADPIAAASEYGDLAGNISFRSDVEGFISIESAEQAVVDGRIELPPVEGVAYKGFVDAAGGGGQDAMTLAISHLDSDNVVVLDAVRIVRPPFSPDSVVEEFSNLLKSYSISELHGDKWAGNWPASRFSAHGIATYIPSRRTKSELYLAFAPLLNSGRVELLDVKRITQELTGLERRTARAGRDSIDHAPGAHDDLINSVAGSCVLASEISSGPKIAISTLGSGLRSRGELSEQELDSLAIKIAGKPYWQKAA